MGANQNTNKLANVSVLLEQAKHIEAADRELLLEEIRLPLRDEKFAHAYAATGNLTKAAIATGRVSNGSNRSTIHKIAHYYWKKPEVRRRVRQILLPILLDFDITAYKVIGELAKTATADITDFVGIKKLQDPITGRYYQKVYIKQKALTTLRKTGDTSVIKEITQRKDGSISVKLHDKSAAQSKLSDIMLNTMTNMQKQATESQVTSFAELLRLPNEDKRKKELFEVLATNTDDVDYIDVVDKVDNSKVPKSLLLDPDTSGGLAGSED